MIKRNLVTGSLVAFIAATSLVGCGQSMQSANSQKASSAQEVDVSADLKAAEEATNDAMAAMADADEAMKSLQDENGNINLGLFKSGGAQSQGLLTPILDKLRPTFDKVFEKILVVKAKFQEARAKLVEALTKLDPNIPAQAAMIEQIKKALAQIDAMEQQFRVQLVNLTGKMDQAVDALTKIISRVTNFIPGWGWIVDLVLDFTVMSDVRDFINEIKMKLLTL